MTFRELRAAERSGIMAHVLASYLEYLSQMNLDHQDMTRHAVAFAPTLHRELVGDRRMFIRTVALRGMASYNSALVRIYHVFGWNTPVFGPPEEFRGFFARVLISLHLFGNSLEEVAMLTHDIFADSFGADWSKGYVPQELLVNRDLCGGDPDSEVPYGELLRRQEIMNGLDRYYLLSHLTDAPAGV